MAMSAPDTANSIVGQPVDRVEGALKVTGKATYAAEFVDGGAMAHGYMLGATIARGRIAAIDTAAAERVPGVIHVMTYRNAPPQPDFGPPQSKDRFARARPFLSSDQVRYFDEPVALVVADSLEAARYAAGLIEVSYRPAPAVLDLQAELGHAYKPEIINAGYATDTAVGDVETAFRGAPVRIDVTYVNAYQNNNPMEPHAALAIWSGDRLTVYMSTQNIGNAQACLANTLQLPPEKVRVISPYIGGGFGSKVATHSETILAALAARQLNRPVKLVQTRQQMFCNVGHRPAMVHKIRLGAARDGRLDALSHEVWEQTARFEEYVEQTAVFARALYAAPNRLTRHRAVKLDLQTGDIMRAPGEAPGLLAFECAMDELAHRLGIDPVELRLRNEPKQDPERHIPYSTRHLVECLQQGASRFGWERRPAQPATLRDGRLLIGYGMAAAIRPNYMRPAEAMARLERDGRLTCRLDMTDIGTGTYTILTQIAAEGMGLPVEAVEIKLGDSSFPRTPGSGGSFGAASSGTALHQACATLRQQILQAAAADNRSPLRGANIEAAEFRDGYVIAGGQREVLRDLAARLDAAQLEAKSSIKPSDTYKTYSQHSYGAHFAEVSVDMDTCEIRLRRMLGVFDIGRALNRKTAHSQLVGGMIWGVSSALEEEGVVDGRYGQFVNHDLAEYHVPVNADVPNVEAMILDAYDDKANPFGAKGVGELGICGAGAAVANAVFNATGVRVREFPITLDKLVPQMPMFAI